MGVTNCLPYHQFGHIGFVYAENPDGTVTTIEQNIDGNADRLYNGGWTRKVTRNLDRLVILAILIGMPQPSKW